MSKSPKLPAFQFYPGDWRKDPGVQALDYHDRGVWFEMLLLMHESDQRGYLLLNGKPMPEAALARTLGLVLLNQMDNQEDNQNPERDLTTTLTTLLTYGVASRCNQTGAIYSRRMVRDENIRKVRQESGKMGGNPVLLNQNSTTQVKQKSTPSVSSSSSSSDNKNNPPAREMVENDDLPGNEDHHAKRPFDLASLTEDQVVAMADRDLISKEFAIEQYNAAMGRGGTDWNGVQIKSWRHFIKGEHERSKRMEKTAQKGNSGANGGFVNPRHEARKRVEEKDWSKVERF